MPGLRAGPGERCMCGDACGLGIFALVNTEDEGEDVAARLRLGVRRGALEPNARRTHRT